MSDFKPMCFGRELANPSGKICGNCPMMEECLNHYCSEDTDPKWKREAGWTHLWILSVLMEKPLGVLSVKELIAALYHGQGGNYRFGAYLGRLASDGMLFRLGTINGSVHYALTPEARAVWKEYGSPKIHRFKKGSATLRFEKGATRKKPIKNAA